MFGEGALVRQGGYPFPDSQLTLGVFARYGFVASLLQGKSAFRIDIVDLALPAHGGSPLGRVWADATHPESQWQTLCGLFTGSAAILNKCRSIIGRID
jgi:hypothetical protein